MYEAPDQLFCVNLHKIANLKSPKSRSELGFRAPRYLFLTYFPGSPLTCLWTYLWATLILSDSSHKMLVRSFIMLVTFSRSLGCCLPTWWSRNSSVLVLRDLIKIDSHWLQLTEFGRWPLKTNTVKQRVFGHSAPKFGWRICHPLNLGGMGLQGKLDPNLLKLMSWLTIGTSWPNRQKLTHSGLDNCAQKVGQTTLKKSVIIIVKSRNKRPNCPFLMPWRRW